MGSFKLSGEHEDVLRLYRYYRVEMGPSTPLSRILRAVAGDLGISTVLARIRLESAREVGELEKVSGVWWGEDEEKQMEELFDALRTKYPGKTRLEVAEMVSRKLLPHRTRDSIYQRYWQVKSAKNSVVKGDMVGVHRMGSPSRRPKGYRTFRRRRDMEMVARYANSTHCHDGWEDMTCLCQRLRLSKSLSVELSNRGMIHWNNKI